MNSSFVVTLPNEYGNKLIPNTDAFVDKFDMLASKSSFDNGGMVWKNNNSASVHLFKKSTALRNFSSLISCGEKWTIDVMTIITRGSEMKINIQVKNSKNKPCQLCSVEGKLSSHKFNVFSEFGSFTNATGFASVSFRFDGGKMKMDFLSQILFSQLFEDVHASITSLRITQANTSLQ